MIRLDSKTERLDASICDMALVSCAECEKEISDRATACPQCGCPLGDEAPDESKGMWKAVTKARTPINVFAIAMMAAASLFGASATQIEGHELEAFTYSLHIFLAVAGMFFACLLFCKSSIYHPDELAKAKRDGFEFPPDRPGVAAALIGVMLTGYAAYQAWTLLKGEG